MATLLKDMAELFGKKGIEALPELADDTVFLCGRCRILRYTYTECQDGRHRCPTCAETMMSVNHSTGRAILIGTVYEAYQPNPRRTIFNLGSGRSVIMREVNRIPKEFKIAASLNEMET